MFRKLMLALCLTLSVPFAGCSAGAKGGLPDYCYVQAWSMSGIPKQYFYLYGHRKWDSDVQMGIFESVDEAVNTAKKVDCPFRY